VLLHCTTCLAYTIIFKKTLTYLNSTKFACTFKSTVSFYDQTGGQYIDFDKNKINEFNFKNTKINKKNIKIILIILLSILRQKAILLIFF
jgi:hypothetical protein